jgi:uncharacterized GH25 family protein
VRSVHVLAAVVLGLVSGVPETAYAHRAWLLPSATVLSGSAQWVTVDAAVSNDLFYFEHNPLRLDTLAVTAPDGSPVKLENVSTGKFRSTFDVPIHQPGTYRLAVVNQVMAAMYEDGGEVKRWRGSPEAFATALPPTARNVRTSKTHSRLETFVTSGKPTDVSRQPSGVGIELLPITHPNDVVQGEPATFRLVGDGRPAVDVVVAVVPGGIRYRDSLKEMSVTTDRDGRFTVTFPDPGMYWMSTTIRTGEAPGTAAVPSGDGQAGAAPTAPPFRTGERVIYAITIEVMAR